MKTVNALFDSLAEAQSSLADLHRAGFDRQHVNLIANAGDDDYAPHFDAAGKMHDRTEIATEVGTTVGSLGGLVVGLSFFVIPGVGPVLAAGGLLASVLTGATVGTLAGSVVGTLASLGVPAEEVETYAEGIRRGGTLVVVSSEDDRVEVAREILDQHHPVDLHTRVGNWRETGWQRYDEAAPAYTREQILAERELRRNASPPRV